MAGVEMRMEETSMAARPENAEIDVAQPCQRLRPVLRRVENCDGAWTTLDCMLYEGSGALLSAAP